VVADRPVEVIASVARNIFVQLICFDLSNFNYTAANNERYAETMPTGLLQSIKRTRAFVQNMPIDVAEVATALLTAASLLVLLILWSRRDLPTPMRGYVLSIVAGIVINAAICGALSGPKGRYEMRLIWILPVIAGAMAYNQQRPVPARVREATKVEV
jgi:hypothetical protein